MSAPTTEAAASVEDTLRRAASVPSLTGFPSVDETVAMARELEAAHPDLVSVRSFGASRLGEPLWLLIVRGGAQNNLIVGGVHPNEPIGFWTALHLARELVDDEGLRAELDATWHIVLVADPDGARLNEAWFADPGDRASYSRRFYRPAPDEQVEWSLPTNYKRLVFDRTMPESQALVELIDEIRPTLYASLHNGEMGGVYYYLSREMPALNPVLHALPERLGLPLKVGEAESAYLSTYGQSIYAMGTISEAYDYLEGLGVDPLDSLGGSSPTDYSRRYGTLSIVAELPYWSHPDADDASEIDEDYGALVTRTAETMREAGERLIAVLAAAEPHLTIESPFLRGSRAFVPMLVSIAESDLARAALPEAQRPATVAERFDREDLVTMFKLRYGGMLLRALEAEVVAGIAPEPVRLLARELEELYREWQVDLGIAADAVDIPVEKLVGVQYGAVLAAARALASGGA